MRFLSLIIAVIASYSIAAAISYLYLAWEFQQLRKLQRIRNAGIFESEAYKCLSPDHRAALEGFVLRELNESEWKRTLFQTVRNCLVIVGGLSPIFAILTVSPEAQKVINTITSVAVLILGVFSVERFAIEHRRAGYLIDRKLMDWLSGGGTSGDRFEELVGEVGKILDTGETSFIGAGSAASQQVLAQLTPPQQQTDFLPPPPPLMPEPEPIDDFAQVLDEWGGMGEIEITQGGRTIVKPEDFAQWQANRLRSQGPQ